MRKMAKLHNERKRTVEPILVVCVRRIASLTAVPVIVTVSNAPGKEVFHSFEIIVD